MSSAQLAASNSTAFYDQLLSETCSEASLIAPGFIQPHGVLLVLQSPALTIRQISANAPTLLNIPASALLDHSLKQVLSPTQYRRVLHQLNQVYAGLGTAFELRLKSSATATQAASRRSFRCQLHPITDGVLLELEPQQRHAQLDALSLYHRLQTAILELRRSDNLIDLAQRLAHTVAYLTGFDRVMIYQFQTDEHGIVIAEAKQPYLESYLGLHYPAFDIPQPSRRLFLRNWIRMIPHVQAPAVELMPARPDVPVDLSDSVLRGVSPYHLEYLDNMGVTATMTISLITEQRLWGLIACHHYQPKIVDYEVRKTCELLGQLASIELMHQQSQQLHHYQQQVKAIQADLQRAFLKTPNFIEAVLTHHGTQLLELVHAQGAAILIDDHLTLIGNTPSDAAVKALVAWLGVQQVDHLFHTHHLSQQYPPASEFKDQASGLLAVSIRLSSLPERSYHLLWFRPEQIQTVDWAGNPLEAVTDDEELGRLSLCPRRSFALWQETVQEQAIPWEPLELTAAQEMRNTLMLAVLEFSQAALEAEAERAAIANQAKSQFLAKMSHELRTPLNAILGFTQVMLRDNSVPVNLQHSLDIIGRSGEHLLTLINDVLEMSKIEAGQLELHPSCFYLGNLLYSIYEMFALKAAEKGLELQFAPAANLPQYICTDQAKLRQILINLLSNAIKFTDQGHIRLAVNWYPEPDLVVPPGPTPITLAFEVTDTGCGIPPEEQAGIFEAFRQTQQGRDFEGTGLGLAISRQFARLMGGNIALQQSTCQGSNFVCYVMVQPPGAIAMMSQGRSQQVKAIASDQPHYRLLIAEDSAENRQLLLQLLTVLGFEVRTAEHGRDAIQQWETWNPDLILMDIQMPQLDGLTATRQIRQREQQQQRTPTPIIAITAYAFESDRDMCLAAGCNDYLAKPFEPEELFDQIARQLNVRYCYVASPTVVRPAPPKPTLSRQDLAVLTPDWRTAAHEAALDLDDVALRHFIQQLPLAHQALAAELTQLLENFQLDEIARLTDSRTEEQP